MVSAKKKSNIQNSKMLVYLAVLIIVVLIAAVFSYAFKQSAAEIKDQTTLKKFSNYNELNSYVKDSQENYESYGYYGTSEGIMRTTAMPTSAESTGSSSSGKAADYSTTNVQVEGVDEADFVKNDGKYIYTITGSKIVITDAYPAENARIISTIEADQPQEIFVNGDRLVVFGYVQDTETVSVGGTAAPDEMPELKIARPPEDDYYQYYFQKTFARVYDVSDKANPVLVRDLAYDGSYVDSRMIGDYVYFIISAPVYYDENDGVILPSFAAREAFPEIYYFDMPVYSHTLTDIVSLNVKDDSQQPQSKVFMLGYSSNIYASQGNIYISYQKIPDPVYIMEKTVNDVIVPVVPQPLADEMKSILASGITYNEKSQQIYEKLSEWQDSLNEDERASYEQQLWNQTSKFQEELSREYEKTIIHKISLHDGSIEYMNAGEVYGTILNQFSMDEYNSNFRVATTSHHYYTRDAPESSNNVYVLDSEMNVIGTLEDIAPDETIYSARFIGNRAYLVTFKKIDPFFVIDLSDPSKPAILGKLKIPGYSDYLHPYDENHIIGLGKETVEAESEFGRDFAWYQGIKMSLFDVTDVTNPIEVAKVNIGDRGTDSYALSDHKAFLFSKSRNLLVIPILLAEIDESQYPDGVPDFTYGEFVWQGAYVFDVTLENGFVLKGKITHVTGDEIEKSGYYFYSPASVKRSLYMDDVLYTVSDSMIKANSLADLTEIKSIELPYEYQYYGYGYPEQMPGPRPMPV